MSTKEMLFQAIDEMTEEQLEIFSKFFNCFIVPRIMNEETISVIDDIENGRNIEGPFNTVAELMEALNAED